MGANVLRRGLFRRCRPPAGGREAGRRGERSLVRDPGHHDAGGWCRRRCARRLPWRWARVVCRCAFLVGDGAFVDADRQSRRRADSWWARSRAVRSFDVVFEFHLAQVAGVPGCDGFRFGGGRTDVAAGEVFDFGVEDLVAVHLVDEQCFGLYFLPHHRVVGGFGDVVQYFDDLVLVALADDSAFSLFKVGGSPRDVDVVQRDGAGLHVGAGAHFFCDPMSTDTSPRLHWANRDFSSAGLRASWTNRIAAAGIPRVISSSLMAW